MNEQQLTLTRLLGKKEKVGEISTENLTIETVKTIPATLSDLHRWMNEYINNWRQEETRICYGDYWDNCSECWNLEPNQYHSHFIEYDSSKDLLDQSTETLARIIDLINNQP